MTSFLFPMAGGNTTNNLRVAEKSRNRSKGAWSPWWNFSRLGHNSAIIASTIAKRKAARLSRAAGEVMCNVFLSLNSHAAAQRADANQAASQQEERGRFGNSGSAATVEDGTGSCGGYVKCEHAGGVGYVKEAGG